MKSDRRNSAKKIIRWIALILLITAIKIFSSNPLWVEHFYSVALYAHVAKALRILFGWIPFSFGDILYFLAFCWIAWKIFKSLGLIFKKQLSLRGSFRKVLNVLFLLGVIYIMFYAFWGLNYDRKGIAFQLQLEPDFYDTTDLFAVQNILLQKVNAAKSAVIKEEKNYPSTAALIDAAKKSYEAADKKYPFLKYEVTSVKSSLYGSIGNYLGFTGYYNPFTGEAQINTTVPQVLRPYIATHEIAHQLGYAKENAANFVGYLAAVSSPDILFHYSAYLELFLYTNREIYYFDSSASDKNFDRLSPEVKKDILELRAFNEAHQSFVEPVISWLYGNYLKLNNQPKGLHTYNAVVGMLIAYYKKYGEI